MKSEPSSPTASIGSAEQHGPPAGRISAWVPPERIRLSLRIMTHLAQVGPLGSDDVARPESTQQGIARALSVTQGAVSKIIGPLVAAEVVRKERLHVRGQNRRVKVYFLTVRGDRLAAQIRARFGTSSSFPTST